MPSKCPSYKKLIITLNIIDNTKKYIYKHYFLTLSMEEQSIFIQTLGDYPLIRVLDFLIYSRDFDYPITEIAKNAGVNFQTLKKLWPQLEQNGTIVSTRTLGGITLYRINTANPVVKKLIEFNHFLCWEQLGKIEKEQEEHEPKKKIEALA